LHEVAAGDVRERRSARVGADRVVAAVDHEHGTAHALAALAEALDRRHAPRRVDQRLRIGVESPADAVLDLLGRVRLGEHPPEEELEEARVVAQPVVAVVLGPALVGVVLVLERVAGALRMRRGDRYGRPDVGDGVDPLGMVGGQQRRPQRAGRERDEERAVGPGGVHDRERVVREPARAVGVGAARAVGAPVAPTVEGEHPVVAGEVRDLRLPVARVDDRPRRQEQHRALALAVQLVEEAHAVALDVALLVRIAGARLLGPLALHVRDHAHRFFSSSSEPSQRPTMSVRSR
jgi:hypothetical protein